MLDWLLWTACGVLILAGCIGTGWWLVRRSGAGRRCPACAYDMASTPGWTCPECGHAAASERHLTRRWGRGRLPRWIPVIGGLGGVAGVLAGTLDPLTGWWWLAPDWVLIRALGHVPGDSIHSALLRRIDDGNPSSIRGREESLSRADWQRLANGLANVLETRKDVDSRAWAIMMLAGAHPYAEMVDPQLKRLMKSEDCELRGFLAVGVASYIDQRGGVSEVWRKEYVDLVTDADCPRAAVFVTMLGRIDPLPKELLVELGAALAQRGGPRTTWDALALGVARGKASLERRREVLSNLRDLGDPNGAAAVDAALAQIGFDAAPEPAAEPQAAPQSTGPLP